MEKLDLASLKTFFASLTLEKITPALLILVVGFFVVKALLKLFEGILSRSKIEKSIHGFLRATLKILLYAILVLIAAGSLGIDVTSLVALLSVASLAVSLAVQGALANVAGGVMILTTHPFHVGDFVEIAGVSGEVAEIGMSYTRLVTPDKKEIYVPNSEISSSKIINYTHAGTRRVDLTFSAAYSAEMEEVKMALLKAAMHPAVHTEPVPFAAVSQYGESAIEYVLRVWTDTADYWDVYYAITERVKTCFDEAGIAMTYPHLNVHLDSKS